MIDASIRGQFDEVLTLVSEVEGKLNADKDIPQKELNRRKNIIFKLSQKIENIKANYSNSIKDSLYVLKIFYLIKIKILSKNKKMRKEPKNY